MAQLAELQALAEHMRPSLKPSQGPTPRAEHIMAAILMTRDASLGARAACRMVPGVNEAAAKSRVAKLAVKVRALLSSSAELSVALPEVAAPQQLPPHPCLRAGGAQPLRQAEPEEQQEDDLGLPPLTATRELPKATSPLPSPTDAENSDVERMIVKPFELLALMPPALTAPASALLAAPSPTMMPLATTTTASAPPTSIPSASILPASMPTASVVPEIPSRSAPKLSSRLHPFDKAAYEAFIVPERARADFDKDSYLLRESLLDPDLRCLVPPALRRHRPLPTKHAALAADQGHHNARSARRHLRSYGYLHGIGPEPEDLGDEWENMFTPTAPSSKPHKWHHDASSDSDSDCSEASSDVEGASTCDHLQSSDFTCDPQASLDDFPQDFGDDHEPQPTPLQLHAILQGGHAPLSRFIGTCRVQLHSLLRNELNGRCGVILRASPPPHERVPVQLEGSGPPIMVKPHNILILPPEDSDNDSSADEGPAAEAATDSLRCREARPSDECFRCRLFGHWARDCTEIVCGNCKQRGHYAADCPDPAPCFCCGQLGHWAKDCTQLHADQLANTETRWIIFEPLTLKIYRINSQTQRRAGSSLSH